MTRKHFEAIANAIRQHRELCSEKPKRNAGLATLESLAWDIAGFFEGENPRFDRARFLRACGVEATKELE